MNSNDIRKTFLKFFEERGHRLVPSSSLVPTSDPTLLFTNAGMNQFKDVFLGREKRDYTRACSSQKCVRAGGKHNDLEQVGRTRRHHTFFEMLGNFSFGEYFKAEAIPWAWELVTQDFAISRDKLYVTVFREDQEAEELWAKILLRERIFRRDEKDNFWAMGDTGPCGPCSEIHYDLGPQASELGHPNCKFPCPEDCGRYVELWNLVFMQFNRDEQGRMTPLPRPSIDTGAGLERLAAVLQNKISNFHTDLFRPLIEEAAELANVEYGANHETDVSLRIIADHARAATFLNSDGVLPSNEGRGYVLRLILRRALYHGQTLGLNEPFLFKMSGHVVDMMKGAYPELAETAHHVAKAINIEEERYAHTTRIGVDRLEHSEVVVRTPQGKGLRLPFSEWRAVFPRLSDQRITRKVIMHTPTGTGPLPFSEWRHDPSLLLETSGAKVTDHGIPPAGDLAWIPGKQLFTLHDTFGLRPEFVNDIVKDFGLTIDIVGYEGERLKQRERARMSWKEAQKTLASLGYLDLQSDPATIFDGYECLRSENCRIVALIREGKTINEASPGEHVEIILDHTPFYGEAGGQVGDTGRFETPDGSAEAARILDTFHPMTGIHGWTSHRSVAHEALRVGDIVTAQVDAERRDAIRRNHTATHLLHAALRSTLGTHVKQAGSLVAPDRLRFDFTHYAALDEQDLLDIEDLVNQHVLNNEDVVTNVMDLDSAVNSGAMALFGEKYADRVRVVSIADGSFSKELCGGTHVRRTGDIGLFKVISEGSVAAGTRRIEALTGAGVLDYLRRTTAMLEQLGDTLRAKPEELLEAAAKLAESEKKLRKGLEAQQLRRAASEAGDLLERAREVKGVRVVSARVEATGRAALRQMVDSLRPKLGSGVIALGSLEDGKVALIVGVTQDLTSKLDAGKIVREAAAIVDGTGGGRKDLAEAGGKNPARLDESLQAVPGIVEKML